MITVAIDETEMMGLKYWDQERKRLDVSGAWLIVTDDFELKNHLKLTEKQTVNVVVPPGNWKLSFVSKE